MLLFLESRCAWGNQRSGVEVEVKVKERELGEALDWRAKLNTVQPSIPFPELQTIGRKLVNDRKGTDTE